MAQRYSPELTRADLSPYEICMALNWDAQVFLEQK